MFGYLSSEFFLEKNRIFELAKFLQKSLEKSSEIVLYKVHKVFKSLPWLVNEKMLLKIVKCCNILYCNIVCKNVSRDVGLTWLILVILVSYAYLKEKKKIICPFNFKESSK